jgi:hypothetical protein
VKRPIPLVAACLAATAAAAQPRYAEDVPKDAGYAVVLEMVPDDAGWVRFCNLHSVRERSTEGAATDLTPNGTYVADACRKLSTKKWKIERDAAGEVKAVFYFCRYLESSPERAYCERRFGD